MSLVITRRPILIAKDHVQLIGLFCYTLSRLDIVSQEQCYNAWNDSGIYIRIEKIYRDANKKH